MKYRKYLNDEYDVFLKPWFLLLLKI